MAEKEATIIVVMTMIVMRFSKCIKQPSYHQTLYFSLSNSFFESKSISDIDLSLKTRGCVSNLN